ncbi:MAG: L-rhamnose mutarotase [Spirochaetaceae bacterium]
MRTAFKMKLYPGFALEYKKRHDEIWPELVTLLKGSGIYDYSIFIDEETNSLFAVHKTKNNVGAQELGETEIVKKWWKFMSDIMECNSDNSPVTVPLEEVFFLS